MRPITILTLLAVAVTTCGNPATIAPPADDAVTLTTPTTDGSTPTSTVSQSAELSPAPTASPEGETASAVTAPAAPPSAINQRLVAADSRFGFKLLQHLAASAEGNNIFLSPTSIALALTLLHNGAVGATREALAATLELQDLSPAEIDDANA